MNVCFISHSSGTGGAELALVELAAALRDSGVLPFVLVPSHGPLISKFESLAADIACVPYRGWMSHKAPRRRIRRLSKNVAHFGSLVRRIRRWNCDVIVSNTCTVPVGALAALLLRKPHVWFIHEFGTEDHGFSYDLGTRFSSWIIDRASDSIAVNSEAVKRYYARFISPSRLRVVHYSVDVAASGAVPPKPFPNRQPYELALVGTIHEGKGQLEAVEALGLLRARGILATLTLAGDADPAYLARIEHRAHDLRITDSVRMIGHVDWPARVMALADMLLVCSRCEAFGRVTVEALKLGRPVIGSDSGGTPEIIRDRSTGLLYEAGSASDLAEKIKYLVDNPQEADRLAATGQAWAQSTFTPTRYAREFLEVMEGALASRKFRPDKPRQQSSSSDIA